ncbi:MULTISPECIES: small ribosomal subunit biogenesis GTPase RsgA [unclassified Zymobacter]|uniref:small ribosomal subunit biogenesis GTPase RsgA n=1 Tax=unclassified Zymobacter TaxID=3048685 RepID=UPI0039C0F810
MAGRKLTRQQRWRIDKIQAERNRRADKKEAALDEEAMGPEHRGRVIAHFGRTLEVEGMEEEAVAGKRFRCHQRANLESLVTGDIVSWRELKDGLGVVVGRFDRHSTLERPDARGILKPVAANIDRILIVVAVEPVPFANLIDRYLVAAEATGITPALVINKTDLPADPELDTLKARYQRLGYDVLPASVRQQHGLDVLREALKDLTTVFVGQSGVGKSSLINTLLPSEDIRVGALSEDSRKGTHTTTTARLYHFPAGGDLIDSPGIREFGLGHLTEQQVTDGFVEFRPFLGHCRFRDCMHREEPGCALREAVAEGKIDLARFESYQRIIHSLTAS